MRLPEDRVMDADLWFLLPYEPERWQERQDVWYLSGCKQLRQVRAGWFLGYNDGIVLSRRRLVAKRTQPYGGVVSRV